MVGIGFSSRWAAPWRELGAGHGEELCGGRGRRNGEYGWKGRGKLSAEGRAGEREIRGKWKGGPDGRGKVREVEKDCLCSRLVQQNLVSK